MEFIIQPVNFISLAQEARMEMEPLLLEKELQLDITHDDIPLNIECDEFRIGQVVRNLLSNAIKFTPGGKKIDIVIADTASCKDSCPDESLHDRNPGMQVSIIDEGPGIPADEILSVFEKFRQSRTARTGEGTGLGLPICKEIIEAHRGLIWAKSEERQGTSVRFILPYSSPLRDPI